MASKETASKGVANKYADWLLRNLKVITIAYVALTALAMLFLLRDGDDLAFHLQRMDVLMAAISQNGLSCLPLRFYDATINGWGYACPLFYCDLFFYPFAILGSALNLPVIWAYKIMVTCVWVATYFTARMAMGWFAQGTPRQAGLAVYLFGSSVFMNITDAAIGRAFAAMFAPLAIGGLFLILCGKHSSKECNPYVQWIPLCLGMCGLIFSNVLDTAIVFVALLVLLFASFKHINLRAICQILIAAVVAVALTLWFLGPLLEQMASDTYFSSGAIGTFTGYTIPLVGLILPHGLAVLAYGALGLDAGTLPFGWMSGSLPLIAIMVFSIAYVRKFEDRGFFVGAIIVLAACLWMQTPFTPFMGQTPIGGIFQMPWRLGVIMFVMGAVLMVKICSQHGKEIASAVCVTLSVLILCLNVVNSYGLDIAHSLRNQSSFAEYDYSSMSIGACDYVPITFKHEGDPDLFTWQDRLAQRGADVICTQGNAQLSFQRDLSTITLTYATTSSSASFEFPKIYFNGYTATNVTTGETLEVHKAASGLAEVTTTAPSGIIVLTYGGTPLQHMSVYVSAAAWAAFLIYVVVVAIKRKARIS